MNALTRQLSDLRTVPLSRARFDNRPVSWCSLTAKRYSHIWVALSRTWRGCVSYLGVSVGRAGTQAIRDGRGHRAYRRARSRLKAHYQANDLPCAWCGKPFDWSIKDSNAPGAFTADHPEALNAGGALVGQALKGFHRSCNAKKSDGIAPNIRPAT